tara:strand:- start:139 stop:3255 length:3117 start_codon:yes stop_codon:yes gene_type:complete
MYKNNNIIINDKTRLSNIYFDYFIKYSKKYGENTVIFMQVGSFFEMFGIDNIHEKMGNIHEITSILNIAITSRNKKLQSNIRKNPLLAGIHISTLTKYLNVLIQNKYTVVLIEEVTPKPNIIRKVTNIYSPGTYIDNVMEVNNNNIVSIFIECGKCYKSGEKIWILGMSSINLLTGNSLISEIHSKGNDLQSIIEEIYRFMESCNPSEVLINGKNIEDKIINKIKNNINLSNRIIHINEKYSKSIYNITYQNTFLSKIFTKHGMLSPIEYLDLERKLTALLSFIIILQFSYEHNEHIIKNINKPEVWDYNEHLTLYHDSIYQLNVLSNYNSLKGSNKISSLFDVINKTKTVLGKRLLKYRLTNPIVNCEILSNRYELIDNYIKYLNTDETNNVHRYLRDTIDIERLHKKIVLNKLEPCDFYRLHNSYKNINKIIKIINNICDSKLMKNGINDKDFDNFKQYQKEYKEIFIMEEIGKYKLDKITNSFINTGYCDKIDKLSLIIKKSMNYLENESDRLSNMIDMNASPLPVKLESTECGGYFLATTKLRYKKLKDKLDKLDDNNDDNNTYDDKYISTPYKKNRVKLINKKFKKHSDSYLLNISEIRFLIKDFYIKKINELYLKYEDTIKLVTNYIAEIDLIQSCANCSLEYGYVKPIINYNENKSYFDSTELRHPIIERLPFSSEYVPNDIKIDKNILLYGVNGSGKSSLSKAVGLNIILAQMGMFVPCKKFIYSPYNKIFTRINSDDNIFKGQSSFIVEMCELRSILKYSDKNSLVLGDEICNGTEMTSSLSIIYASIKNLIKNNVSFILASHFHKLYELCSDDDDIIKNLSFKHLTIDYSDNNIKYVRKLSDGLGDNIYGIEIAKFIIKDDIFIKNASLIRNKILNNSDKLLNDKKSIYNKNLYVDKCSICGVNGIKEDLHTHHIKEQQYFDNNDLLGHIKKNNINNLVVLCKKHHHDVHHGKLNINGYDDTTNGKILNYEIVNIKKSNKKFNNEMIEIINKFKNSGVSMSNVILQLKNTHDIKISKTTLSKIFNGKY